MNNENNEVMSIRFKQSLMSKVEDYLRQIRYASTVLNR